MKRIQKKIRYGGVEFGKEEKRAIDKVLKRNWWGLDKEAKLFEQEAAAYIGTKHCIITNSGSSAALLAMTSLELPKGSEVIIPATTFPTVFNTIIHNNLTPVVIDSNVGTYNLDLDSLRKAISKKTKAIWVVHVLGNPCDMKAIMNIARPRRIHVLEDNCDGFGSTIGSRKAGSFGDISITSFHAAHIVSMGEGGGVFTNNNKLAQRLKMYRDWGNRAWSSQNNGKKRKYPNLPEDYNIRYIYEKIGYNLKPLELQAAMGRVQLRKAELFKKIRQRNFQILFEGLKHFQKYLMLPKSLKNADLCWLALPLTVQGGLKRKEIVSFLESWNIETRSLLAGNIIRHPAYKDTVYKVVGSLSQSDRIMHDSFFIGLYPGLSRKDLSYILDCFDIFFTKFTKL